MEFLPRTLFDSEHEVFRRQVRRFCEDVVASEHAAWEKAHAVPRELWREAGRRGLLCCWLPESYGGPGADLLFDLIVSEELGRVGATGPGFPLHSVIVAPYLFHHGTEAIKQMLLPAMVSGQCVGAIAMTEPGAGSDVASIRTRAEYRDGRWIINGQKTFITNGHHADMVVVACKTGEERGAKGVSLFVVTGDRPGFSRGRSLQKIGQHAQDTAELFFDQVEVGPEHLLGNEGEGFRYLMQGLAQERLLVSVQCQARAEAAFDATVAHVKQRRVFGQALSELQNTRFRLADLFSQLQAGRAYCDRLVQLHLSGQLDGASASAGKLWHSEMLGRVVDECVQLHGGYGYMREYPVARAYVDARIERIYAGTSEIMKEVIARRVCDAAV